MPGLVKHDFDAAGKVEHDGDAVTFEFGFANHVDAFGAKVANRGVYIVAHQAELVARARLVRRTFGRMNSQFGRRECEDQPAVPGIDVLETEDVAKHGAKRFGLGGVKQDVGADDWHGNLRSGEREERAF
jgi:hypothetical protein